MIGVLCHEDMSDERLGWEPTFDQIGRGRRLCDPIGAGPASVFRAHGYKHAELGRDDVQALAPVFADPVHASASMGTVLAFGLDDLLNPRQVLRQVAEVALHGRLPCAGTFGGLSILRLLRLRNCHGQILESELAVVFSPSN